ncbi:hypothetical protein HRR83_002114 [Exophiala dermatitidis]|uniref:R3H domain-containing protein n=1 Tax=Exophiala dermatitidis TaxID=5970 RepID=A0AAN6EXG3_EXODE|nr:hypothetical protein HRR75_002012 [Exophiala dermatitidis]KAJ4523996.1 hypothetical protein HRR74_002191 [Exophiala dermatitidis]KAJ4525734.1 hypothetical protein HRR73_002466 [Exophiala dermatitidis]KAJ4537060.1 hypothetical protein HRR76_005077 [Exophiala dermatitidis]KAJ4555342.1 hypothetical protein HRR77_001278 [Exophiala dermatitidis]
MASPQVGSVPAKLSFAKVAAMRPPTVQNTSPNASDEAKARCSENPNPHTPAAVGSQRPTVASKQLAGPAIGGREERTQSEYVTNAIKGLSLGKNAEVPPSGPQSAESGDSLWDDQSHLSNSSLKQQSFDTKSMASVTTFAMDEKESIRPDDSASVRAAEDDDSLGAQTRELSSHRSQEPAMLASQTASRPNTSGVTMAVRRYTTLTLTNPPRFGDLPVASTVSEEATQQPRTDNLIARSPIPHDPGSAFPVAPDEKLIDALANPKDRLPLLQLEEKFLGFISNSGSDFLDLPPQNAFARLLSHKLADYYSLAHHINEDGTSIRLFRTPCQTRPTPLHVLAQSIPTGQPQAPAAAAVKIMRRAGLGARQGSAGGSTAGSSSVPSKATSEAGVDANVEEGLLSAVEGMPSKDKSKLTREEREAQYKAARERIFGDFQESVTSESASTGDNSASMSRSSSSSGKRKPRKHKTPKDDSFEARSAFIPSYPPMHLQHVQSQYQPQYAEHSYQAPYQGPPAGFGVGMTYGTTPTQAYPGLDPSMQYSANIGYGPSSNHQFNPADSWSSMQSPGPTDYLNYSAAANGYQQNAAAQMLPQMNGQYMPPTNAGMQQPQNWMNGGQYQAPYQQSPGMNGQGMNGWSSYASNNAPPIGQHAASYGYGQLSGQPYGGENLSFNPQQPALGGYSRSLFNPQTRSFVPSNALGRTGGRNSKKKPSPSSSQSRGNNNNNANASKSFSTNLNSDPALSPPRRFDKGPANNNPSSSSNPQLQTDSLQQKYGAPSHLPKKPPPSAHPRVAYDGDNIASTMSSTGSGVVSGAGAGAEGADGETTAASSA